MDWYRLTVTLHVLAATVWVGGQLFIAAVLVPAASGLAPSMRIALVGQVGRRFRWIGWLALLALIGTGIAQSYFHWRLTPGYIASGDFLGVVRWRLLTAKLALVALVLVLSAVHDFALGPRLARLHQGLADAAARGQGPGLVRLRRSASWLARLNLVFTLTILVLAALIAR